MKTKRYRELTWHLVFIAIILIALYPILFAVSTSLKTLNEAYNNPSLIPQSFDLSAYQRILRVIPFVKITLNTFIIATVVTIFKILTGVLAAYSFVFLKHRMQKGLYFALISTIFIPFTVTMIPNFILISRMGLNDNIFGVILPQLADATGIFLLRQHMRGVPKPLLEVADLENVSHLEKLRTIIIPIIKPAILSIGIIFFINSWNEYVWPSLMLKSVDNYTLPLALQMFVSSEGGTDIPVAMAISVLTMFIPLMMYITFQRYIIDTFVQSGIKG